jgi:methionyl-tRNA formyltransferase
VVRTPASLRDPVEIEAFRGLQLDAAVVVAYGQILTGEILQAPRLGAFNLHASLLPRWRGAAPIQRAIMAGDAVTGVQVMQMSEGLDEGPVLLSQTVPIAADDTAASLHDRLATVAAGLAPKALEQIATGRAILTPQASEGVVYAKKIKSNEARIDWSRSALELDRHIRGLSPFPGAWFEAPTAKGPVRVKALMSRLEAAAGAMGAPGEVIGGPQAASRRRLSAWLALGPWRPAGVSQCRAIALPSNTTADPIRAFRPRTASPRCRTRWSGRSWGSAANDFGCRRPGAPIPASTPPAR